MYCSKTEKLDKCYFTTKMKEYDSEKLEKRLLHDQCVYLLFLLPLNS